MHCGFTEANGMAMAMAWHAMVVVHVESVTETAWMHLDNAASVSASSHRYNDSNMTV